MERLIEQETLRTQKELNALISKLPTEVADNLPKYSEREMREMREKLKAAKDNASFTRALQDGLYIRLEYNIFTQCFELTHHLYLGLGESSTIEIKDVSFDNRTIIVQLDPETLEMRDRLLKATRR